MSHSEELPDDPIFAEELARSDIDSLELAHYLYDGKEKYDRLIDLTSAYALDPQVKYQYNEFDNTRKETFYSQNRKLARLREITKEKGMPPIDYTTSDEYSPPLNTISSTSLHHSMFETVLRILGSEEQKSLGVMHRLKWVMDQMSKVCRLRLCTIRKLMSL